MSATIFKHEFLARIKSVIIWSVAVMALIFAFLSIFPAFSEQTALLSQMFSKFPPALLDAFGMNPTSLTTLMGFFALIFLFAQICLAIQAGNYGFGLVSVEESELTADFLLSKPVSRTQILNSKLLAALVSLTITNAVVWISSILAITFFRGSHTFERLPLVLILVSIVIFQLFFLSVGLVVSLLVKRVRSVTPYSLGLGFGTYFLAAFSGLQGTSVLEIITPFKHFDPNYIVQHRAYNTPLVLFNVVVIIVALAASYWLYTRRDIPATV